MPGTTSEYFNDPNTRQAESVIDEMISDGAGGGAIIEALETAGLRVYNLDEIEEIPGDEYSPEEGMDTMSVDMADEGMDEGEYEGGPMLDSDLHDLGPGPSMAGGDEGGNRGMIIEAVRFGIDEDKKKKSKSKKSE